MQIVYLGSAKELHFREFTATPCACGQTHHPERRYQLSDKAGAVVLQCVRGTSLQDAGRPSGVTVRARLRRT